MDFGNLISAVEGHVCLYDKSDKNYKNLLNKEKAWDEVSEIVGLPKEDCKKKWSYLRGKFNKENKKKESFSSGIEAPLEDEWPYMESLMFLKQFIQPRKTKSNNFCTRSELSDELETTGDDSAFESVPPKRLKPDPFADTCLKFQEILDEFSDRHKSQKPAETADDQFFKTIRLLYEDLPNTVKDTARLDILGYITNLRSVHLNF